MSGSLRIGLFTHSVNPRGGVVHTLALAEALEARGHQVVVHAPAEEGQGFFRAVSVGQVLVPAARVTGSLAALVRRRVDEYVQHLTANPQPFDVYHAQDGISGNALATLAERGEIPGYVRTVHHVDVWTDPFVSAAEARAITEATRCLCVSRVWQREVNERYGVDATVVSNGVDLERSSPRHDDRDVAWRHWLGARGFDARAPTFLAVGGVERRKNTINIARAFVEVRRSVPTATLLIVGGASLLDHSAYRREFEEELGGAGGIMVTGPVPDELVPAAYRAADALVFPSLTEGFGLAVLEAMACGTPVITSRVPPFTEYLTEGDAMLVDPRDSRAIARAMREVRDPAVRERLIAAGRGVARRFTWARSAAEHEAAYVALCEPEESRRR